MRPNRLFQWSEMDLPEYIDFGFAYERTIPGEWIGNRMRPWEHWAALEGLDWRKYRRVLDVGGFYSSIGFYLKSRGADVSVIDSYQWVDERKLPDYCYSTGMWEEVLRRHGIKAWEQDARFLFTIEPPPDLITLFSTIEHVQDYGRVIEVLLEVCQNLIITTDCSPDGKPFEDYARQFSFEQLHQLADDLEVKIDTSRCDELSDGRTLAVIRRLE